jgi:hypothetical protein
MQSMVSALMVGAGAALLSFGCEVDVKLGFSECKSGGVTYADRETFGAPDGCNTCTCEGGAVSCTALDCDPCLAAFDPGCDDGTTAMGCELVSECGPDGWVCTEVCSCDGAPMPPCGQPLQDCSYEGPICEDGQWTCGKQVCPPCRDEIVCPEPSDPLCYVDAYCTERGWQCGPELCPPRCPEPARDCKGFGFADCTEEGWVCSGNETCGMRPMDCPPSQNPYCQTYAECQQDGWVCQESCDPAYCPDEAPICEPDPAGNCAPYPVCTSQGWVCGETCS